MREGIHPNYYQATVTCNCGNTFVTGSTKQDIHVEICSKCHPFYTGQQKAVKARGAIDKFNRRYGIQANQQNKWSECVRPYERSQYLCLTSAVTVCVIHKWRESEVNLWCKNWICCRMKQIRSVKIVSVVE